VDREWGAVARAALAAVPEPLRVVEIADPEAPTPGESVGGTDYGAFLAGGGPGAPLRTPADEWETIALSYTSGTTGDPKGVVTHHRGAYLNACGNALAFGLSRKACISGRWPMFHCNGWTYTWAVTCKAARTSACGGWSLRPIFAGVAEHGVTHLCAAPVVLTMLIHAPAEQRRAFSHTPRASPPAARRRPPR
jgi:fatty-acyl-CoA synthase